jgi:hypothetical protein
MKPKSSNSYLGKDRTLTDKGMRAMQTTIRDLCRRIEGCWTQIVHRQFIFITRFV